MGKYVKAAEIPGPIDDLPTWEPETKEEQERYDAIKKELEAAIEKLNKQLKEYEADFVKIQDASVELAKLYALGDNTEHTLKALDNNVEEIDRMGKEDQVPGFEKLFDGFYKDISDSIKNENKANGNLMKDINKVGNCCTAILEEIGEETDRIRDAINLYQDKLNGKGEYVYS